MSRTRTLIAVALMSCLATLAGAGSSDQFEVVFPAREMADPSTLDVVRTGERTIESVVRPGMMLRVVDLEFTSFDWAGETWRHEARLVLPAAGVGERARGAGVVVAGIRPYADAAAAILGVPALLVVSGNPGPRYGEPREGELMGVSLARQAETGDPRWNGYAWSSTAMSPANGRFRAIIERPGGSSTVLFVAVQDSDPATCDGYVTSSPIEIAPTG